LPSRCAAVCLLLDVGFWQILLQKSAAAGGWSAASLRAPALIRRP
jgi:hypothetical protein